MKGIYKITNITNNKFYIGSSVNINKRKLHHLHLLRNSKHGNTYLQKSWNKYGEKSFDFEILEFCENIIEREQYYIDTLKPTYNLNPVAGSCLGRKHYKETKDKIGKGNKNKIRSKELKDLWSKIKKENPRPEHYNLIVNKAKEVNSKKILQLDKQENFIKEWNSLSECAKTLNLDVSTISKVCKNKLKTHKGFIFKYINNG